MQLKQLTLALLVTLSLTALLHALPLINIALPQMLLRGSWLLFLLVFAAYTFTKKSLTTSILFAMAVGIEIGVSFPAFAQNLQVLSKIFLLLIKSIIAPLLFGTLVVGIAGHSDLKQVGRMGWKSLLYFEVVTTIALAIGLIAINISQAGVGLQMPTHADLSSLPANKQSFTEIILHIFPENIAKSVAEGQVLQIVLFSVLFGIGLSMTTEKHRQTMLEFCESLSETMFKYTKIIMYYAPIGVGAAIAYTVGHMGIGVLIPLFKLLLTLYCALIAFVLLVLVPVALFFRINIIEFAKRIAEPVSIAFATTSSESALPKAMRAMENFGVPRKIVSFVMPMGYSFNLDGTTLYLSLASVFVAQAAGHPLSWEQQIVMALTLMLTSKGVAGVPRASLVILLGTVAMFDLPVEPVFLILGIDELMDMARTSVNVVGNCLATAVVARWEGELGEPRPMSELIE